jgi:hypothetical protein
VDALTLPGARRYLRLVGMWEVLMYIVSHRNSKGCSYTAWKGVWPLWVLVGQTTCFTDRVIDVPTLFGEDWVDVHCVVQRTVTVGWKLWMLVGHTLY